MAAYGEALRPFYAAMTAAMRVALFLLARWEVQGRDNVPPHGPLILVSNHLGAIDPPLIAASINRRISFLAKRELFQHTLFGPFIRAYGALPINRGKYYRDSLDRILRLLGRDRVVGLFPEGTRSRRKQMRRARPGVALVALQSGAPVLPVAVWGSERVTGMRSLFTRPRITVSIGQPFTLPVLEGPIGRAQLTSMTDMIMRRVAVLLPPEYRGDYSLEAGEASRQGDRLGASQGPLPESLP